MASGLSGDAHGARPAHVDARARAARDDANGYAHPSSSEHAHGRGARRRGGARARAPSRHVCARVRATPPDAALPLQASARYLRPSANRSTGRP